VSEGLSYINPSWVAQRDHAKANGLVWGGYHYPHMGNSAQAEADYFLSQVNWQTGDLIVLDWEGYDPANQGVSRAAQLAYKEAWLRYVKARMPHNPVGMYCNADYWRNVDTSGFYGDFLWIATAGRSAGDPGIQAPWLFHQFSDSPVDSDYCHLGSTAELRAWAVSFAGSAPATTTPAPTAPAPIEEDPLAAFTEDDLRRFIREEVGSQPARDAVAFAVDYLMWPKITQALADLPNQVWNHEVPVPRLQPDGTVTFPFTQAAYWPLIWGNVWTPQILSAIKAASLTPEQVQQALADGTLHVQVTVAPVATPATPIAPTPPTS
jgi:hypothetical protein